MSIRIHAAMLAADVLLSMSGVLKCLCKIKRNTLSVKAAQHRKTIETRYPLLCNALGLFFVAQILLGIADK
jgi:hypothetical protein